MGGLFAFASSVKHVGPDMNAFNHYSFATIGAWFYRYVAGINPDPERPGYRRIRFRPHPSRELGDASATLESVSGCVSSAWRIDADKIALTLEVPPNSEGVLEMAWLSDESGIVSYNRIRSGLLSAGNRGLEMSLGPGVHSVVTLYVDRFP
jgi:alpha-L-rhamnosidase